MSWFTELVDPAADFKHGVHNRLMAVQLLALPMGQFLAEQIPTQKVS
jgi:hypothetical protein